jgi:hypothetical protein
MVGYLYFGYDASSDVWLQEWKFISVLLHQWTNILEDYLRNKINNEMKVKKIISSSIITGEESG